MTKLPILISYAYLRDWNDQQIAEVLTRPDVEVLLDCGAFTVANTGKDEIDLDDYMAFCKRWEQHLFGYIALDKLGDPQVTETNLAEMVRQGLRPWPVHVLGDDAARMDHLFGLSDTVALGGLRRPGRAHANRSYVKAKMDWARGRNVHWLGYTNAVSIASWRPFSCDCSNFTSGARWGQFFIYVGKGKMVTLTSATKKTRAAGGVTAKQLALRGDLLAWFRRHGYSLDYVLDESNWTGPAAGGNVTRKSVAERSMATTPAFSYVRYSLDVRQQFGTRFFLACAPDQSLAILDVLDFVRANP